MDKYCFFYSKSHQKVIKYLVSVLILLLGIICYAKIMSENSFGADNPQMVLQANLEKYINYKISDVDKGTLLQYNIRASLENTEQSNINIIRQSQIKLEMSKIDNKYPYEVKVITRNTELTNGNLNKNEIKKQYNEQNGTLIIQASNLNEKEELINTSGITNDSKDEYTIICYYDTYIDNAVEREINIKVQAISVLNEENNLINKEDSFKGTLKENIGELTSVEYETEEVSNGYIKSNIINETNYDTEYREIQNIVVSKKEAQEKIWFRENNLFVTNLNEEDNRAKEIENNNELVYKSTKVYKENLLKILGKNGKLEILDNEQNLIAIIDENTKWEEDGAYTINFEKDMPFLLIKTSEIKDVGILKLENTKVIKSAMKNLKVAKIKTVCNIFGIVEKNINNESIIESGEQVNNITRKVTYNNKIENEVEIKDSTTNVEINLNKTNWTNKEQNDVIFDIKLKSISYKDNLFSNPKIKIDLPEEVEKVILEDGHIIYGNGLELQNTNVIENNNGTKSIIVNVSGNQTDYYKNQLGLVTTIQIPATIILKKDIVNNNAIVNFIYSNDFNINNVTEYGNTKKEIELENYKNENLEDSNQEKYISKRMLKNSMAQENNEPKINTEVELERGNSKIADRDTVYEGEYIKYNIKVKNISEEKVENIKVVTAIPEELIYSELKADYHNYMGEYKYNYNESLRTKEINVGELKSGEVYNTFFEVKVKDLEINQTEKEFTTVFDTYINENIENNLSKTNITKKAEVKVFLGAFLDNSEDRWNYSLKVESKENKEVNVDLVFPEEYKVELRVKAGGQDGTNKPVFFQNNQTNTLSDTIQTNTEYWYEGIINSNLIKENVDNKPVILNAYATATIDGIEYKSNENRIEYESRSVSVTMTSENEGEDVSFEEEVNYKIEIKNTGRTNLNQEEIDVFSIDVHDYLPEELEPISLQYENWEQSESEWIKKKYNKDIENKTYYDEKGNKLPDIDLTLTIPYNQKIIINVKTTAKKIEEKTTIKNIVTITGKYINTKSSNIISHTILPFYKSYENNNNDKEEEDNNSEKDNESNGKNGYETNKEDKESQTDEQKYNISGIAWLDENADGQRQESEAKLSRIDVVLVESNNQNKIVSKTSTNNEGIYEFNNLSIGNYIILFKYETEKYMITEYKSAEVSDELNSDVNNQIIRLDGREINVGVTDIIELNANVKNIDIGLLKKGICDLKLDKYISSVTVNTKKTIKQYNYENQKLAKIEIHSKEIDDANIDVEYKIVVTNEGEIPAYVNEVIDYIPEGFIFNTETNKNWGMQTGGELVNSSLTNKKLNPGEIVELDLILTKKMTSNAVGEFKNIAEIGKISNVLNIEDKDSIPCNKLQGEDDYSEATLIISISTGGIIFISIAIISILILIITAIILSKKRLLKNNNIIKIAKLSIFIVIFSGVIFAKNNTIWSADSEETIKNAPSPLYFAWQPNSSHRNAYGSVCFISSNGWEAHCQNAGLAAATGNYSFVSATGEIDSEKTNSSTNPSIKIEKVIKEDEVNVNTTKRIENGIEYWMYGPLRVNCTVENNNDNSPIEYSIEADTYNGKLENDKYDITNENGDIISLGNNAGEKTFYLKIKKDYLKYSDREYYYNGLSVIIINAKINGKEISTKKTSGFLQYSHDQDSQSIKTTERHPAYTYTSAKMLEVKDSEMWSVFNVEININKIDEDDPNVRLQNVGFSIRTGEKGYLKKIDDFSSIKPKGYNENDWIEKKDFNQDCIQMTDYDGKINIRNLRSIGFGYFYIREEGNNTYGYDPLPRRSADRFKLGNTYYGVTWNNYGNVIDLTLTNRKNTGNLEIYKEDKDLNKPLEGIKFKIRSKNPITSPNLDESEEIVEDGFSEEIEDSENQDNNNEQNNSQEKYIIAVDSNNNIQSSVTGNILLGNLKYTDNKDEATEFITNEEGKIQIYNLLIGDYVIEETSTNNYFGYDIEDSNSISWSTSCMDVFNRYENNSGNGKEIQINIKRQKSTETKDMNSNIANKITVSNKKECIKIKGYAWQDGISGKDSEQNNLYDNNVTDKRLENILVKLYKKDENDNVYLVDTRLTDKNGEYIFGDYINDKKYDENGNEIPVEKIKIDELESYFIEFEYNGMHYETTDIVMLKDEQDNETDLVEDNSSKVVENISKSVNEGISKTREEFNNNFATIEYNKSNEKNLSYNHSSQDYASKLNLGQDIKYGYTGQEYPTSGVDNQFKMTANKDDNIYNKNEHVKMKRILGQNLSIDEIRKLENSEITNVNLGLRKREMPDLSIATDINKVEININGYKYEYLGNKRNGTNDTEIFNAIVKAGDKYKNDSYTRELYESDCEYTGDDSFELYATYEVKIFNEATDLISNVNSLNNYFDSNYYENPEVYYIVEGTEEKVVLENNQLQIENYNNSYKRLKINNLDMEINGGKVKSLYIRYKLKNYEGIIEAQPTEDKPLILNHYTEISSYSTIIEKEEDGEVYRQVYGGIDKDSNPGNFNLNENDENKQYNEDDNDKAPAFKLTISPARQIQGTVFLDKELEDKNGGPGKERLGNGIYDTDEDTITGVEVTLTENKENGQVYTTTTDENGNFILSNFIPGEYVLTYNWGNETHLVKDRNIKINAKDYKGTIWTASNKKEKEDNKNNWYKVNTETRYSDAKDNLEIRKENGIDMKSSTNTLVFGIDLNDDINSKEIKKELVFINTEKNANPKAIIQFIIPNIDFGIIKKPVQSLEIKKSVQNINIQLSNGQTIIDAKFDDNGNLVGTPKGVNYLPAENKKAQILISLDSELIQGAKADITYKISVNNNSEKDYSTNNYYYYGIPNENYLIKIKPEGVYDYLDNKMNFNSESNQIEGNGTWEVKTLDEYNTYKEDTIEPTIIEKYLYEYYSKTNNAEGNTVEIKGYESFEETYKSAITEWNNKKIIEARQKRLANKTILHNSKLEEPISVGGDNSAKIMVSKILSNQDDIDLNNESEIVKIIDENDGGTSIHPVIEKLYDKAESIVVSANPGKKDYTIEIIEISTLALIILSTGIILIKRKVLG